MNKNTLIGLLLLFALFIGYSWYMTPSKEEQMANQRKQDSLRREFEAQRLSDSISQALEQQTLQAETLTENPAGHSDTLAAYTKISSVYGVFALSSIAQETKPIVVENDLYRLTIGRKGGKIEAVELKGLLTYDSLPVFLFKDGDNNNSFGFNFNSNYLILNTDNFYFTPTQSYDTPLVVSGEDSVEIAMRLYPDKSHEQIDSLSYIEFLYTVRGNDYRTGLKINFVNTEKYINRNQTDLQLIWQAQLLQQEKNVKSEKTATTIYYSDIEDVENLREDPAKGDSLTYSTRLKWVSFKQLFFTSTIIADDYFSNGTMVVNVPKEQSDRSLKNMKTKLTIPFTGENQSIGFNFYFGPNKYRTLKQYGINLEDQIQLGWKIFAWINKFAIIPIFNFFESFGWNYGIIILILAIIIKVVLFPLTMTNYKSSAKMRVIKPEVEEINKRYPKPEDAMKKQQAVMTLYRQAGVKPMAGCLPMLLQMPILIAMFRFFPSAYELRQKSFLWADDLSTYDSIASWDMHIPLISSFYGNHISLFTLLMTIATLLYTFLNNKMMATSGNEQQMKMMKWMMYLMPVMFLGIFNNYSAGLSYYYLLVNLITFIQMWVSRLLINEDKLHAQMQARKNKPVTKSKWQKRMEDMVKQQQAVAAQQRSGNAPQSKQRQNTSIQKKKKK
ncbi:MAG: membrane protein insertase YidC [Bacteroidales bacterium]|jgi:YidC/Oxa1 family membrane protein insertase|nr:membrane protein insertase YidC [Bacteroidales bacterium]